MAIERRKLAWLTVLLFLLVGIWFVVDGLLLGGSGWKLCSGLLFLLAAALQAYGLLGLGGRVAGEAEVAAAKAMEEPEFQQQIQSLLQSGRKIEAIKLWRMRCGAGLKEAKDAVDARQRDLEA